MKKIISSIFAVVIALMTVSCGSKMSAEVQAIKDAYLREDLEGAFKASEKVQNYKEISTLEMCWYSLGVGAGVLDLIDKDAITDKNKKRVINMLKRAVETGKVAAKEDKNLFTQVLQESGLECPVDEYISVLEGVMKKLK